MTYALSALGVVTICVVAGYVLACIDLPEAPPPRLTRSAPPRPPLGILQPPAGNQQRLEAAPHRGRLIAWSGSIWRSR